MTKPKDMVFEQEFWDRMPHARKAYAPLVKASRVLANGIGDFVEPESLSEVAEFIQEIGDFFEELEWMFKDALTFMDEFPSG